MLVEALLYPGCLSAITAMFLLFPEYVQNAWGVKFGLGVVWFYAGTINTFPPMALVCGIIGIALEGYFLDRYVSSKHKELMECQ